MIKRSTAIAMAVLLGGLPVWGDIVSAEFDGPTKRYGHAVLGDDVEYTILRIKTDNTVGSSTKALKVDTVVRKEEYEIRLPIDHVFEDIEPRLADITGNGQKEVIVIETDMSAGAALAVYDKNSKIAETPHIGTRNRWLAPIGVADFNGDGDMDVAYVDRPHLAKTLRVWTYRDGGLTEIASIKGVTNHSIGEPFITSSIRTCDGRAEMILNDARRTNIISVFFEGGKLTSKELGKYNGPDSVINPPAC